MQYVHVQRPDDHHDDAAALCITHFRVRVPHKLRESHFPAWQSKRSANSPQGQPFALTSSSKAVASAHDLPHPISARPCGSPALAIH